MIFVCTHQAFMGELWMDSMKKINKCWVVYQHSSKCLIILHAKVAPDLMCNSQNVADWPPLRHSRAANGPLTHHPLQHHTHRCPACRCVRYLSCEWPAPTAHTQILQLRVSLINTITIILLLTHFFLCFHPLQLVFISTLGVSWHNTERSGEDNKEYEKPPGRWQAAFHGHLPEQSHQSGSTHESHLWADGSLSGYRTAPPAAGELTARTETSLWL